MMDMFRILRHTSQRELTDMHVLKFDLIFYEALFMNAFVLTKTSIGLM